MITNDQKHSFIDQTRQTMTDLMRTLDTIRSLQRKYTALDLGSKLIDDDFSGRNDGIESSDFIAAMTSVTAIIAALPDGADATVYKISY